MAYTREKKFQEGQAAKLQTVMQRSVRIEQDAVSKEAHICELMGELFNEEGSGNDRCHIQHDDNDLRAPTHTHHRTQPLRFPAQCFACNIPTSCIATSLNPPCDSTRFTHRPQSTVLGVRGDPHKYSSSG